MRWRVGSGEFRVFRFQLGEPAKQPVILGVADQRVVEYVILIVVLVELSAQLENFLRRAVFGCFCHSDECIPMDRFQVASVNDLA